MRPHGGPESASTLCLSHSNCGGDRAGPRDLLRFYKELNRSAMEGTFSCNVLGIQMDASWIASWRGRKIFVLGDVMLDKFIYGKVERISPEAPIPILHRESEKAMLGGAANVARNIVALGGRAILAGAIGDDADGDQIVERLITESGIDGRLLRTVGHPTTTKVRFVSGVHQIMRLDIEQRFDLMERDVDAICGWLTDCASDVSALVLSDYSKGLLAPLLIQRVISIARAANIPVVVDPKSRDVGRYAGASVITPNASETTTITGLECADDAGAAAAARKLREMAGTKAIVLTRGAHGMTIFDPAEREGAVTHVASHALEVFDVSGAGDTVVACLALAMAAGASVTTGARIGNAAAGIAVSKRGTAVVTKRELSGVLDNAKMAGDPKIVENEDATEIVATWREKGLNVGFTNGCFDIIHLGHVSLLKHARAACDRLVVGLNTDASVRRLKGEGRPVQNERARSAVMAAMESVDLVTLFGEDTPQRLIELLKPDRLIKGSDYNIATVVGADFVQSYGGRVVLIPIISGQSTTSMIARVTAGIGR